MEQLTSKELIERFVRKYETLKNDDEWIQAFAKRLNKAELQDVERLAEKLSVHGRALLKEFFDMEMDFTNDLTNEVIQGLLANVVKDVNASNMRIIEREHKRLKISLKPKEASPNVNRIKSFSERCAGLKRTNELTKLHEVIDRGVDGIAKGAQADSIRANVESERKAGLSPTITRTMHGHTCPWCLALAGTYDADDAPADIYRRHDNCRCSVVYKCNKWAQNVHTKKVVEDVAKASRQELNDFYKSNRRKKK